MLIKFNMILKRVKNNNKQNGFLNINHILRIFQIHSINFDKKIKILKNWQILHQKTY